MRFGAGGESHYCTSTPRRLASFETFSMRHAGIEFADFQLDTVDGVSWSARATLTVPPSASMMSDAVFISALLRYS